MANRTLHSPYNTLTSNEWLRGWSEMLQPGAYERGIFGDLMIHGIACGLKKVLLIFNTNPDTPHDPIYVVKPSDFDVDQDTEIPIVLCYNMSHYESLEPCTEHDVQATVNLVKDYKEGRYSYSRKDIPNLISPNINLQLPCQSPNENEGIKTKRQKTLDMELKKMRQRSPGEKSKAKDRNRIEDANDEINLAEIDDYLDSCNPKISGEDPIFSREGEKTSNISLTDNNIEYLFYQLNGKSKNYKIQDVEGKMKCPFCKTLVKNIKIHFERKLDCGNEINMAHFVQTFETYQKGRVKEANRMKQQRLKEKDPAKFKQAQDEARQKRKEVDPAKYKEDQKEAREKRKKADPAKYKEDQKEARKKIIEKDPTKYKENQKEARK